MIGPPTFLVALTLLAFASLVFGAARREFVEDQIVNPTAFYPEGPQLVGEGLLVAEMAKDRVVLIGQNGTRTVWSEIGCGPTSIKKIPAGGFWVLCHLGHHVVRLDATFHTVLAVQQTTSGRRIMWPNDGSVDSAGDIYLSSSGLFSLQAPAEGRVVFIDAATNIATDLASGYRYTNGVLVQEGRHRVLVSEHLNRRVLSFPLLGRGRLGAPSVFFDFSAAPAVANAYSQSGPDGMAAFANGDVVVADYGNGRLLFVSDSGQYSSELRVRDRFVTNMAITRDEQSLYVVMTESNASPDLHGIVERFRIRTPP
jgi:sugar lactone lactonase YvrE